PTRKAPQRIYLAPDCGRKAPNVPIVLGVDPPLQLFQVSARKIIGLSIDPYLLHDIRSTRANALGMPAGADYADPDKITQEVRYSKKLFRELKCHTIDVSAKAIEETSSEVFLYLRH